MTIKAYTLCTYYPDSAHRENKRDQLLWDTHKFCSVVKKGEINGYFTLPPELKSKKINITNIREARRIFGRFIKKVIEKEGTEDPVLVPIPSKDSFEIPDFRSLELVREALGADWFDRIVPAVIYNKKLDRASSGGPRWPDELRPHLDCVQDVKGKDVILVDDIITTGSSLLVMKEKIEAAGGRVLYAVACGRTRSEREKPWKPRIEQIEEPEDILDF